jgi:lipopolysaccharide transport system permease protein
MRLTKSILELTSSDSSGREVVIRPPNGYVSLDLREIYEARFLLWNLIRRNAKVPNVDLSFGFLWTVLRPVIFVMVFFFIKHASNANLQSGLPYTLYVYSGLILWWYFVDSVMDGSKAIFKDSALINRVYYPRIITPAVPVVAGTMDLFVQMSLIPVGMLFFKVYPDWHVFLAPLVLAHVMVLALGMTLIVAALSTLSRDYAAILKYFLYVGLFLSPVIFSPDILAHRFRGLLYLINPMAAPLVNFRAALFGGPWLWSEWITSIAFSFVLLGVGVYMFRRRESYLADNVL